MKATSLPWARISAEFLVIFLGVSLSLAADDWRQSRGDRAAERRFLSEMSADLRADSSELESVLRSTRSWDSSGMWLWRRASQPTLATDSVVTYMRRLGFTVMYSPVTLTYVGLKDTGRMSLISDDALRRQITEYYEMHLPDMRLFDDQVSQAYGEMMTVLTRHANMSWPDSAQSFWPLGELRFVTSWTDLVGDEEFRGAITRLGAWAANWTVRTEEVFQANARLREAIDNSLTS